MIKQRANLAELTRYPIPENEKERLIALHSYAIMDSLSENEFDRMTELASLICDVPISLVSLIDENRQWFVSKKGIEQKETHRNLSFCQYTIMGTEIIEVSDAEKDSRFQDHEMVTGGLHVRFYAGCPLIDPEGYALGTLCVVDQFPHILTAAQRKGLKLLADEVTALIVARKQLQLTKQQAGEASSCKSEFLANVSHELRTPLNGVIGFTDLVLKSNLNQTQHQYLSVVNQSANTLLGIINDILDFSKIKSGKLELDIDQFDLREMAGRAIDMMTYPILDKEIKMLLSLPADLPGLVWADGARLKQILINLLGNSVKFTEKGEIELKIKVLPLAEGYGPETGLVTLHFEVRDTGIGIPERKQEKIFEAFSQADCSITKKYGGTGLGLTISNKLLGLMGSRLQLKSKQGEGSCFYFDITFKTSAGEAAGWKDPELIKKTVLAGDQPLLPVSENKAALPADPENKEVTGVVSPALTILIAEDNRVNMLLIRTVLKRIAPDAALLEAVNGYEALTHCESKFPDLILMDIQMPDMNGYEATMRIRAMQQDRYVPIIAVTAGSLKSEKNRCLDAGMDDIIVKPFVEETLAAVMDKWLSWKD